MKNDMSQKFTLNFDVFKTELTKVWYQEMKPHYFRNLSNSMPKHLEIVIKTRELSVTLVVCFNKNP